ncbi:hypothetical protein SDC9_84537 [bioreactor metagenome]|uniref:Uncharacterized protein n=1 Tax=bioreactor metagenome TaxID=1076179 RepID=A0A644ZAK4_9ZZZZ
MYRLVVGFCKPKVFTVVDQVYFRKFIADHLHRAIHAVVVDNIHFSVNAFQRQPHRGQALFEKMFNIVVDYDNREFHKNKSNDLS